MVLVEEGQATLTATVVRVGARVLAIPVGRPIPEGAKVIGPATRDVVYRAFYEATHCPNGHPRPGPFVPCGEGRTHCSRYATKRVEWTWGAPG